MVLRMRAKRKVLSSAIAQTQTEHKRSPTITALTGQRASKNKAHRASSEEPGTGSSVGFMGHPLCRRNKGRLHEDQMGTGIRPISRSSDRAIERRAEIPNLTKIAPSAAGRHSTS